MPAAEYPKPRAWSRVMRPSSARASRTHACHIAPVNTWVLTTMDWFQFLRGKMLNGEAPGGGSPAPAGRRHAPAILQFSMATWAAGQRSPGVLATGAGGGERSQRH